MLILGGVALGGRAEAGPLDPTAFASLGTLSLAAGNYTITTAGGQVVLNAGGTTYTAVLSGGVAVFDFDSITIAGGATLRATPGTVFSPIALLSRSSATIAGTIDVSAFAGQPGPGAFVNAGAGASGLTASGGGGGGSAGAGGRGGAADFVRTFAPQFSTEAGGAGGSPFSDLSQRLQGGGRGGSGGGAQFGPGGTGAGGGAIELGAVGLIDVSGAILALGGAGSSPGAGGGGGGGIYLHSTSVSVAGRLIAAGGGGRLGDGSSPSGGGGGGGGEVLIQYAADASVASDAINVNGGAGGAGTTIFLSGSNPGRLDGRAGAGGSVGRSLVQAVPVPEPSSLALLGTSTLGLLGLGLARRRPA